jgi:L-fuculose-phosphate aldolase
MKMDEKAGLAERVAQSCRVLGRLDLTRAATGHVSARVPGADHMLIRARGPAELGVRYTTASEVVEADFDGRIVGGAADGFAAPQEIYIHTEIYKARPDVFSVIHMHPPTLVLFTICCKPLLPLYGAYDPAGARLAIDGIPIFDRSILINSPELGAQFAHALGLSKACMMRGHGVTTAGSSVEEAALLMIRLNDLATINYQASLLGDPQPISAADQKVIQGMRQGAASPPDGSPPRGAEAALWRYYCTATDS